MILKGILAAWVIGFAVAAWFMLGRRSHGTDGTPVQDERVRRLCAELEQPRTFDELEQQLGWSRLVLVDSLRLAIDRGEVSEDIDINTRQHFFERPERDRPPKSLEEIANELEPR